MYAMSPGIKIKNYKKKQLHKRQKKIQKYNFQKNINTTNMNTDKKFKIY